MGSSVSVSEEALGMFILGAGGCDIAEECRMTGAQSLFVYENAGLHIWRGVFVFPRFRVSTTV
jgi:hypothetical protein